MDQLLAKMNPRQLNLLLAAAVLFTSAALFTYVFWPKVEDFRDAHKKLSLLENVLITGNVVEQQVAALQLEVESLDHQLHGDMANLSSNQVEAFIIGRMQDISWQHNIELRSVKPGNGNEMQMFEEVRFDLEVAGDYYDLYQWLTSIRQELGMLVIKQFKMTPIERDTLQPKLLKVLTIAFYRDISDG